MDLPARLHLSQVFSLQIQHLQIVLESAHFCRGPAVQGCKQVGALYRTERNGSKKARTFTPTIVLSSVSRASLAVPRYTHAQD